MTVIRLQGLKKETYIKNLLLSTNYLIKVIKEDWTLKKSDWDKIVYEEVAKRLDNIKDLFYFLQKTTDQDIDNFGIYPDIVLSNGGLPEFFSYRQLIDDKNNADEKIESILESENISSKEELAKRWVEIANNGQWENKDNKKNYLLNILPDKYQAIEFYEQLKIVSLFDIEKAMNKLNLRTIRYGGESKEKIYTISWFNYVLGNGVWNIYVAKICEKSKKSFLRKESKIIDDKKVDSNHSKIDSSFKKFLEDHMNSGAFFLAREIDKNFPTIYPERISMFQFGPNYVEGIKFGQLQLKEGEYYLTAQREDIENSGKNIGDKNTGDIGSGKNIWRADKLIEEKFGICSKELEKALKENIKIPNMKFYVL